MSVWFSPVQTDTKYIELIAKASATIETSQPKFQDEIIQAIADQIIAKIPYVLINLKIERNVDRFLVN